MTSSPATELATRLSKQAQTLSSIPEAITGANCEYIQFAPMGCDSWMLFGKFGSCDRIAICTTESGWSVGGFGESTEGTALIDNGQDLTDELTRRLLALPQAYRLD